MEEVSIRSCLINLTESMEEIVIYYHDKTLFLKMTSLPHKYGYLQKSVLHKFSIIIFSSDAY